MRGAVPPAPTFSGRQTSLALFFQQLRDSGFKRRQIAFDNVPDQGKIDAEILVREDVAGTGDSDPGNLGASGGEGFRAEVADDLADDFQIANHRVLGLAVGQEGLVALDGVFADSRQAIRRGVAEISADPS